VCEREMSVCVCVCERDECVCVCVYTAQDEAYNLQ